MTRLVPNNHKFKKFVRQKYSHFSKLKYMHFCPLPIFKIFLFQLPGPLNEKKNEWKRNRAIARLYSLQYLTLLQIFITTNLCTLYFYIHSNYLFWSNLPRCTSMHPQPVLNPCLLRHLETSSPESMPTAASWDLMSRIHAYCGILRP